MSKLFVIVVLLFGLNLPVSMAQGCSDAGVCTVDGIKPQADQPNERKGNYLKVAAFFGKADHTISIWGNYLEYHQALSSNLGLTAKITSLAQSGNDLNAFGISDLFVAGNFGLRDELKLTLGVKFPLTKGDRKDQSLPLPMDYQSSLGSLDLMVGLAYQKNHLQFAVAYQHPLSDNKNEFLSSLYPANSALSEFQSTNKFERAGDLVLRASYTVGLSDQWIWTPGILPIYHVSKDKFIDEQSVEQQIDGSQGLTLNLNSFFDYLINSQNSIQFGLAFPLIVRDARPDGLTRSFIANVEYRYSF